MTREVTAGFWRNLTPEENLELRTINSSIKEWIAYCERCRTSKPKTKIDPTRDVPDELYIRAYHLRTKFFQPYEGMSNGQIQERSGQGTGAAPQVSFG